MKKNKTIRQRLFPLFLLAAGIPVVLFTIVSQTRLSNSLNESIELQIGNNLNRADESLNMILDKYDTILYDLCTDKDIIEFVNAPEVNRSAVENEFRDICNRDDGIEGITLITANGQVIFYDELSGSSADTTWADKISLTKTEEETYYRGVVNSVTVGEDKTYIFQVIGEMVDYRDIQNRIGTIVFSINVNKLHAVLEAAKNANISIVEDGKIIADLDSDKIGTVQKMEETAKCRYTELVNEKSGFTIVNTHFLEMYNQMMQDQNVSWLMIALGGLIVMTMLSYFLTRPYLIQIDRLAEAMGEVEKGNFQVEIPEIAKDAVEIRKINDGFNKMVKQIDLLITQVTDAVVEQKNAELSALEAQIDPHFLYNTLDTINWKAIEENQFEISEMLGALADILRYTVKNSGEETSLEQEILWLEQYILLQKVKLGRELDVEINIPKELYECRIHKLLLQPFVENAMKHGFNGKNGELKLKVMANVIKEQIHITIQDNGNGIAEEKLKLLNDSSQKADVKETEGHLGVSNVRKRLKLYYEDRADLYFESEIGSYTKVHLFIPVTM